MYILFQPVGFILGEKRNRMTMWKPFEYCELGVYHQRCNSLTIFTRVLLFFWKHWVSIYCLDVFKPFLAIHSASSSPPHQHQALKQTTKVIIQADYKTLQQATGHHHKNDWVHIGNCHPAQVKHQHQTLPAPQPCVLSCSVHTIHPWLQLQTMRNIFHNTEIRRSTMESSSNCQNQQSCWFLCWHNHLLLFENEMEVQIDVLSLSL